MEGSIMIAEEMTGEMVPAVLAKALFIIPKNKATETGTKYNVDKL
jgi:hypothetical protein